MALRIMERGWRAVVLGAIVAIACTGASCGRKKEGGEGAGTKPREGPVRIVVSIPPLKGVVESLAKSLGDGVQVDLMVPVGTLEHGYEIPPSMVAKTLEADIVVYVGLGLEPQVEKILANI